MAMSSKIVLLIITNVFYMGLINGAPTDPTKGFVQLPLKASNFVVQRPYNVPPDQRYSYKDGVHRLWVYKNDKPHTPTSRTHARTEIRISGYDYDSGVHQFEGEFFIPSKTSGVCVMQIFGATDHATTLMLTTYNGQLSYYRRNVLVPQVFDKWYKLNVIHDVRASKVQIYIDGVLKVVAPGRGDRTHFFKFGVYSQGDVASNYMESRWRNVKLYIKK